MLFAAYQAVLWVLDASTGRRLRFGYEDYSRCGNMRALSVSADGKHLAAACDLGIMLWRLDKLREAAREGEGCGP